MTTEESLEYIEYLVLEVTEFYNIDSEIAQHYVEHMYHIHLNMNSDIDFQEFFFYIITPIIYHYSVYPIRDG